MAAETATGSPGVQRPDRAPASAWVVLGVLIVLYIIALLDRQVMTLLVKPIKHDLHITDTQMGIVQGLALFVFASLAGIVLGWIADEAPRWKHWIVFVGMIIWSLATAACGLAQDFVQLLAGRSMIGFGEAALGPAVAIILSTRFPRAQNSLANGIYFVGSSIGAGLFMPAIGLMIRQFSASGGIELPAVGHLAAWQATFVVVGLPGLAFAFLAFALRDPPDLAIQRAARVAADAATGASTLVGFMKRRWVLLVHQIVAYASMTMTSYALIAWVPAHLQRNFNFDPVQVGWVVAASYGLCSACAQIINGNNIDRLYRRGINDAHYRYYTYTTLAGIPIAIFTFTTGNAALCVAGICLTWLVMQGLGPLIAPIQLFTPLPLRGRIATISSFFTSLAAVGLAPVLIGMMNDELFHDENKVGWSIAIFMTVMGLIGVAAMTSGRRFLARAIAEEFGGEAGPAGPGSAKAAVAPAV